MIRNLLLSFVLILSFANALSQITVGEQNGSTTMLPIESILEFSYSQQIILQEEINASGPITSISFFYESGNSNNSKKWEIYLGHTSKSSYADETDWIAGSQLTKVFDGTVSFPSVNNFMTINFTTPFTYNNMNNLVVAVVEKEAGNGGAVSFAKTSTNRHLPARALLFSNDTEIPSPNNPPEAVELLHFTNYIILGGFQAACPYPTRLNSTGTTETTANITWAPGASETTWEVKYGLSGFNPQLSGNVVNVTGQPTTTLTNLQVSSEYDFYVRAICGASNESSWTGPHVFSTACTPATLPYTMDFEDATNCIFLENAGSGNNWVRAEGNNSGFSGRFAYYRWHRNPANAWLYTQAVYLEVGKIYELSYKYGNNSNILNEKMKVAIGDQNTFSAMTAVLADHPNINTGSPQINTVLFQVDESKNYYIGFNAYSAPNQYFLFLDDIHIQEIEGVEYVYQNGSWTPQDPSGITTASESILVINGSTSITAPTTIGNVRILAGAKMNIESVLNLYGNLTIEGDLVFKSSPLLNGELGYVSPTSQITGLAIVERYMRDRRSYRMVSSAVTTSGSIHDNWQEGAISRMDNPAPGFGTHITGTTVDQTNGFDATQTGNSSMYFVDVPGQQFVTIGNTDATNLNAGDSYLMFIRGDRSVNLDSNSSFSATTLRAKGTLFRGNQTQTYATVNAGDFAMFGNPYQSAVNVNTVFANGTNVNRGFYYIYDPSQGDYGAYVTVSLPSGTNSMGSTANNFLQPGQAAQYATQANGVSSITFTEAAKAPGNFSSTSMTGNQITAEHLINVQLLTRENYENQGPVHDAFSILFDPAFSNQVTAEDAVKPFNFYENLGIDHNGTYLSIEKRAMPTDAEEFRLFSSGYSHTNYIFKIDVSGLDGFVFFLEDAYTGNRTPFIAGETIVPFTIDDNPESKLSDRFRILVESSLTIQEISNQHLTLFPNPVEGNTFYIAGENISGEVEVSIADLAGRMIAHTESTEQAGSVRIVVKENLASGIYLVKIKNKGQEKVFKLIKK